MKDTDFIINLLKSTVRFIYVLSLMIAALGGFIIVCVFIKNPYFLAVDTCIDAGNVWDDDEKRCRDDCLKWNRDYGCIQITEEQRMLFSVNKRISEAVYKDICLSNQKAWNNDKGDCDFYFVSADCGKLSGSWKYPDSCLTED